MKKRGDGNMLIAQSGGPSMVINQSLVGAVLEAKKHSAHRAESSVRCTASRASWRRI